MDDTTMQKPARRVGSWTLGLVLIACGVCFLLYYFWPGFDYVLVAKLSPLFLIALGGEVLYFSARPERGKYDFFSILSCLFLMVCCFGVTLLPTVWRYIGPARETAANAVSRQAEDALYPQLQDLAIARVTVNVYFPQPDSDALPGSLEELDGSEQMFLTVALAGDYAGPADFAADCRAALDGVRRAGLTMQNVDLYWEEPGGERHMNVSLDGPYMQDWTAEQIAARVEGNWDPTDGADLPDEDIPDEPGESA